MELMTSTSLILVVCGIFIGILSVLVGGGAFFSAPLIQWLFPGVSLGAIIGNIKLGSFFRSIGSTWATHKQIEYKQCFKYSVIAIIGTLGGVSVIHDLSQKWLFPIIIFAIIVAVAAPKIAAHLGSKSFNVASLFIGFYAGFFGAGYGILMIALMRLKYPADEDIAHVKIQARFIEWLLASVAVIAHYLHGNLIAAIWVPWATGSIIGGVLGGILLKKLGSFSGRVQKSVLYVSFAFALIVAGYHFFSS